MKVSGVVGVFLCLFVSSACGPEDEAAPPVEAQSALTCEKRVNQQHTGRSPVCNDAVIEFAPPTASSLDGITAGPDGNVWFVESAASRIGQITPAGAVTDFASGSSPASITGGPDGNLWITELGANQIGRMTMTGSLTELPVSTPNSLLFGITAGPDGNVWFVGQIPGQIGRITPNGDVTELPVPTAGVGPLNIASGPDHNLWFTENSGNLIGRITPDGSFTEFPVPTPGSVPFGIAAGPDGNVWFTENAGNAVGRITPAGDITEFPLPTANSGPRGIAAGPDGSLWVTEFTANKIGRITPTGKVTEFPIPTPGSGPLQITAGPDGHLWFTEDSGRKIGRISAFVTCASAPARLSRAAVTVGAPVLAKVDVRQRFSSVDTVCFDFTFQRDLLDPADTLAITPLEVGASLSGPGFMNVGAAPQSQRTLCIPSSGDPAFGAQFADGAENELEVAMSSGSVRIESLVVTVTGTPR